MRYAIDRVVDLVLGARVAALLVVTIVVATLSAVMAQPARASLPPGTCDPATYAHSRSTGPVTACIAGLELQSRLKKLRGTAQGSSSAVPCLEGSISLGQNYPASNACGGRRVEVIAQARLINRVSNDATVRAALGITWPDPNPTQGGIEPGVQWETSLPGPPRRFPDLLAFDPLDPQPVVYVAEVKQVDGKVANVYTNQIRKYVQELDSLLGANRAQMMDVSGYTDTFSVCGQGYSVAAEDVNATPITSDYDPATDTNALLIVSKTSSNVPVSQQTLATDEEPIDCPLSWTEDGDSQDLDDAYGPDGDLPDFDGIMDALECSIDLFSAQATKAVQYTSLSGNRAAISNAIAREAGDQLRNPMKDRCPVPGGGWGDLHLGLPRVWLTPDL